MLRDKMVRFGLLAAAPVALAMAASSASATVVSSFDNSSSFVTESGFPTFGTYALDNPGTPKVPNVRFDNGAPTPTSTWTPSWSSNDAASSPSSGSLAVTWTWNHSADGDGAMDFTLDVFNTAQTFANLDFDIMVDPSSAQDSNHGVGFFEVITRNQGYGFNKIPDGTFSEELGNPTFASTGNEGTWQHVSIALPGGPPGSSNQIVRALTFGLFNDAGRNINGQDTIYLDNIVLTPVPEPASMSMLALGAAGLVSRRRRHA